VGQIYLLDNPLLREPLTAEHIKPRLLGHWGTTPGLNFIYAHMNRVIARDDLSAIYVAGPGHGGPGLVASTWLEGSYSELYPNISRDAEGMRALFRQFSFPGGIPSHVAPETPGSIHEGGELGYALAHAYGAVLDNPELLVACVVGDGEAETGPLAASWHSNKFLNPATDGAVLPILHLNGYKIANPTVLARIPQDELAALVDRTGSLRCHVAGNPAGERELAEQRAHSVRVLADVRVHLAVGALQIGVGDQAGTAVAGAGHVDRAQVPFPDRPIQVRVDQVQPGRGSPVAEQPRLDVLRAQWLTQQRIVQQIDLSDGQVVRGPPVRIDQPQLRLIEWTGTGGPVGRGHMLLDEGHGDNGCRRRRGGLWPCVGRLRDLRPGLEGRLGPNGAGPPATTLDTQREQGEDSTMATAADLKATQQALYRAAARGTLAPSIHNTQPWRFVVHPGRLDLFADVSRAVPVVDPDGRQLALSCGAALLGARLSLSAAGFGVRVELLPDESTHPDLLATLVLDDAVGCDQSAHRLDLAARSRRSNRREFAEVQLRSEVVDALHDAAHLEGASLQFVTDLDDRLAVAMLAQRAADVQTEDPAYRAELRAWTTDDPHRTDGVPAVAVPHVASRPEESRDEVPIRAFDTTSSGQLPSETRSSLHQTLFVIATVTDHRRDWLLAGQALYRVLLELTDAGYVASIFSQVCEVPATRQE
jgi:hypothetical protein